MSAFWILVLNSWMHTPAGYEIRDGVFFVQSWFDVVFNPSLPYRLSHMLLASGLTAAFLIAGVSAWQVLRNKANASTPKALRFGLTLGAVLIPLQIFVGDLHGLNTLEHQPAKVAAMEGVWETQQGAPLLLFAVPDQEARENRFEIGIPNLASLILTHKLDGEIKGLNEFVTPEGVVEHPPVAPVFYGFRVMVGTGLLMLAASWTGLWWYRRRGWDAQALPRPLLWLLAGMSFSGWVATVAGWYVTEIGRQPFIVQGLLRVDEVVADVPAPMVAFTLVLYVTVYLALIAAYIGVIRYMAEKPVDMSVRPPRPRPAGLRGPKSPAPQGGD
jgi:cytochrome d ubiquinol oxidase subunit I